MTEQEYQLLKSVSDLVHLQTVALTNLKDVIDIMDQRITKLESKGGISCQRFSN